MVPLRNPSNNFSPSKPIYSMSGTRPGSFGILRKIVVFLAFDIFLHRENVRMPSIRVRYGTMTYHHRYGRMFHC